jgi:uncharacterized membrane protein YfcA
MLSYMFEQAPPTTPKFWIQAALLVVVVILVLFGIPALVSGTLGDLLVRLAFAVLLIAAAIDVARRARSRSQR